MLEPSRHRVQKYIIFTSHSQHGQGRETGEEDSHGLIRLRRPNSEKLIKYSYSNTIPRAGKERLGSPNRLKPVFTLQTRSSLLMGGGEGKEWGEILGV